LFANSPGDRHGKLDLGGDTKVLEEPLVRGPELAPHGFLHPALRVNQLGSFREFLHGAHPLQHTNSLYNPIPPAG